MPPDDLALRVLERIDGLYASAYGNLVLYVTILVAVVAFVIPALTQYIQWRSFRYEASSIAGKLAAESDARSTELEARLRADLHEAQGALHTEVRQMVEQVQARVWHVAAGVLMVQADVFRTQDLVVGALHSDIQAALLAEHSQDPTLLSATLNKIATSDLPKLFADDFAAHPEALLLLRSSLGHAFSQDKERRFEQFLRAIEVALEAALQRQRPTSPAEGRGSDAPPRAQDGPST